MDPRILRACPFCSEHEHLGVTAVIARPIIVGTDTLRGPDGREITEEVDGVCCFVCEASAPLDVWNHTRAPADYAVLRDFDPEPQQVAA